MSSGTPALRVALLLLVTLVAGAAAGVAIDRRVLLPSVEEAKSRDRGARGETTIERFADELGLTEDQRAQIAPVLEHTRQRMREVFKQVRPEYDRVVDSARARIEAVLTPEQAEMYRQLLERENERSDQDETEADDGG